MTATAGNGDAMVGWAIPASDGGSPITQYTVTSDLDGLTAAAGGSAASTTVTGLANGTAYTFTVTANPGGQIATPASFTLSVVVTGLDNGTIYTFTVTATNAVGTSATSAASNAVTPPNDPPAVQARADATGKEGALLGLEIATFTDNDPVDTHTASVDWGDGTVEAASVTESGGARTVFASHTYKGNGSYGVTVTATDTFG